jgi:hypothetical protein
VIAKEDESSEVLLFRPPEKPEDFYTALSSLNWRTDKEMVINDQGRLASSKGADCNVWYYFHNKITRVKDIEDFIGYVVKTEKEKYHHDHFKLDTKFGYIKECFDELYEGDGDIKYAPMTPLEYNLRTRQPPAIVHDDKSVKGYVQLLKEEVTACQRFTSNSTKQMIIAIRSMMVTVYRMPDFKS